MNCATEGEWRAYLDGELPATEKDRLASHLATCASCTAELQRIEANASFAASALGSLAPSSAEGPAPAWSRVRERVDGRAGGSVTRDWGVSEMFRRFFGFAGRTKLRIATSAITVFVAMALLFAYTPAGMAAGDFLSIFRVKKFVAVTVDPSSLPNLASPSDLGSVKTTGDKSVKQVSPAEAQQIVGFKIPSIGTMPAGIEPTPRSTMVTGSHSMTFTPDIKKVRAYLDSIGATNVKLPDKLDGAPITLASSPVVSQLYTEKGGVERAPDGSLKPLAGQKFLHLGMTTSPVLTVPDGIDMDQLRSELLKVPGLPPDLVNQLKAIDDWRNTVVIPVVKGKSRDVTIQGQQGVLIREDNGPGVTILWQKDGVIYTLTGNASEAELLTAANSLK